MPVVFYGTEYLLGIYNPYSYPAKKQDTHRCWMSRYIAYIPVYYTGTQSIPDIRECLVFDYRKALSPYLHHHQPVFLIILWPW